MRTMILKWAIPLIVLAVIALVWTQGEAGKGDKHPEADYSESCLDCHQEMTPEITEEWDSGMHGTMRVGCFICHGDGEVEFTVEPDTELCMSCHSKWETTYDGIDAKSCFSCHDGHTLTFH